MPRTKAVLLIVTGTIIHFSLTFLVIVKRIGCEVQPDCISETNNMLGYVPGFPLNVITWIVNPSLIKANGWLYILVLLNSLFVASLLWYLLIRPIINRPSKGLD